MKNRIFGNRLPHVALVYRASVMQNKIHFIIGYAAVVSDKERVAILFICKVFGHLHLKSEATLTAKADGIITVVLSIPEGEAEFLNYFNEMTVELTWEE